MTHREKEVVYVAEKEGYDVLRLIEHGRTCYISSEYVEGQILAEWIRLCPDVEKERLFSLMREIAGQLNMIHKCRNKPYYQYVNPYSIVVTDEEKPYFLDMDAGSNEKRMGFMLRRIVRECFLPQEEAYYQKGSGKLDFYGLGKTFQYLLAAAAPDPSLTLREERRFLKIISKCLNYQSGSAYQSAAEIRKSIPQYKKRTEHRAVIRRGTWMAFGAGAILAGAWTLKEHGGFEDQAAKTELTTVRPETGEPENQGDEAVDTDGKGVNMHRWMPGNAEEYLELATAYLLDLNDYEKCLYYLEKIQEYAFAGNLKEVVEALMEKPKDPGILEASLDFLEKETKEDADGRYGLYLIRGYGLLDTERSAEAVLRLGRRCLDRMDGEGEGAKEIRGYMVLAYEKMGKSEEAVRLYEEMLEKETDGAKREETYQRLITLYEACGQKDLAAETCVRGIGEIEEAAGLKVTHIRLMCQDEAVGRDLCAQTIQEYICRQPEILEREEFLELEREYGIKVEEGQVWAE